MRVSRESECAVVQDHVQLLVRVLESKVCLVGCHLLPSTLTESAKSTHSLTQALFPPPSGQRIDQVPSPYVYTHTHKHAFADPHPFHSSSTLARLHQPSFTQDARQRSVASRWERTWTASSGGKVTRSGKLLSFNCLLSRCLAWSCCHPQEATCPIPGQAHTTHLLT